MEESMKKKIILIGFLMLFLVAFLLLAGCHMNYTSYNKRVFAKGSQKSIQKWSMKFEYKLAVNDGKTAKKGQYAEVIHLFNEIYYNLMSKNIKVTKTDDATCGKILIHPVPQILGGIKSVSVNLYNKNNEIISRLSFENDKMIWLWFSPRRTSSLAEYVAAMIHDYLIDN